LELGSPIDFLPELVGQATGSITQWRLPKQAFYDRDSAQDANPQKSKPCRLPLISIEPIRDQQTQADTERNPRSSDHHDFGN
jgi:hypothetical protein